MRRTSTIIALTGVWLLGVVTVTLAADTTEIDSFKAKQVTPGTVRYFGSLDGPNRCIKNRKFKIIHNGVVIATGETNNDGEFDVTGPEPPNGDKVRVEFKKTTNPDCNYLSKRKTYRAPG